MSESTSKPRMSDARSDGQAESRARGIVDKLRQSATSQLTDQKNRAVDGLGGVTQAARRTTQRLRDQNHDTIAGFVDDAVNQIDRLSQQLRERDIIELFRDLQEFSQRRPAIFIGGAFALGFIGARFLRSGPDRSSNVADRGRSHSDRPDEYRGYARAGGEVRYRAREVATVHDYNPAPPSLDPELNATTDDAESSGQSDTADTGMNMPESGSGRPGGRFRRGTQD